MKRASRRGSTPVSASPTGQPTGGPSGSPAALHTGPSAPRCTPSSGWPASRSCRPRLLPAFVASPASSSATAPSCTCFSTCFLLPPRRLRRSCLKWRSCCATPTCGARESPAARNEDKPVQRAATTCGTAPPRSTAHSAAAKSGSRARRRLLRMAPTSAIGTTPTSRRRAASRNHSAVRHAAALLGLELLDRRHQLPQLPRRLRLSDQHDRVPADRAGSVNGDPRHATSGAPPRLPSWPTPLTPARPAGPRTGAPAPPAGRRPPRP